MPSELATLKSNVSDIEKSVRKLERWVKENVPESDLSITLARLLRRQAEYLAVGRGAVPGSPISMALAVRGVFEVHVIALHVMKDAEALESWLSERAVDLKEFYEGLAGLATSENSASADELLGEARRISKARAELGMKEVDRIAGMRSRAKAVGLLDDWGSLFKVCSKIMHPTAFSVNGDHDQFFDSIQLMLQSQLQILPIQTIASIGERFEAPEHLRTFKPRRRRR